MSGYDPNHFYVLDGALVPQPWMQKRRVATKSADSIAGSYGVSGSQNKNDLLQTVQTLYENDTPMPLWVFGEVTRGPTKVTLQARSRGWIADYHGQTKAAGPLAVTEVSRMGTGCDMGRGGVLTVGTDLAILERREYARTFQLCPHLVGWTRLDPGDIFYARVDVRFVSAYWEGTDPDGGAAGTESTYESGAIRIDLFTVPIIE